jgi:FixJ family two-component response regulator
LIRAVGNSARNRLKINDRAIKGGAIEFLTKPFRDQDLLDAIQSGLARDCAWVENQKALAHFQASFEKLTPREREDKLNFTTEKCYRIY